jgi:hypothetical protein
MKMDGREMDAMGRIGGTSSKKFEFPVPEGMELDGESGRAMVDWELTPAGTIRVIAFDGVSLAESSTPANGAEPEVEMEMDEEEEGVPA